MTTDFGKIMDGFVEAQIKSGPEGALRYLEGVNTALKDNEPEQERPEDRFRNWGSE